MNTRQMPFEPLPASDLFGLLCKVAAKCPREYPPVGWSELPSVVAFSAVAKRMGFRALAVMAKRGKAWPWYVHLVNVYPHNIPSQMAEIEDRASRYLSRPNVPDQATASTK